MSQQRQYRTEIRSLDKGRRFEAQPLAYEVVDDYGTIWTPGVFDEAVEERFPTLLYGHSWSEVTNILGRGIDYRDTPTGPWMVYELTSYDDHPHTRQIASQINEGTITDMSVGFDRRRWKGDWNPTDGPLDDADKVKTGPTGVECVERMLKAGWDETSLVVRGAVPGAKVLTGVRMARSARASGVALDDLVELARRKAAGELTDEEAEAALALLGGKPDEEPPAPAAEGGAEGEGEEPDQETEQALADADAVLEGMD